MNATIHHILNDLKWDLGLAAAKCPCSKSDEATKSDETTIERKQTSESITSQLPVLISPSGQNRATSSTSSIRTIDLCGQRKRNKKIMVRRNHQTRGCCGSTFLS
ncbi:hypothetical protein Nepgr_033283 [Nepenthes gracilis]|uniref:Uncharacterized protein n=1 Tax=Nepenthes gracilis TaxID=150966 RepID=A0AAD3Y896_NEPGR|nr:hypothetical protein Nepgr_033283 [Nepenthes gracilis]